MMRLWKCSAVVAAAVCLMGEGLPAQAETASVSFSDFRAQVITPPASGPAYIIDTAQTTTSLGTTTKSTVVTPWFSDSALAEVNANGRSVVASNANGIGMQTEWKAGNVGSSFADGVDSTDYESFELAPHTEVAFLIDYSMQASVDYVGCIDGQCELAYANVYVQGNERRSLGIVIQGQYATYAHRFRSGTIGVTLTNNSDGWLSEEQLAFFADAGTSIAPPVPEPADDALMLAGLGVLGFVSRRRVARRTA